MAARISVIVRVHGMGGEVDVELPLEMAPGATVATALDLARERIGDEPARLSDSTLGRALAEVIVLQNGEYVRTADAGARPVADRDRILVFPLAAGG